MDVITTHTNADFDTFASMIAAGKLYPEARLVFSGSLEKGLREALKDMVLPSKVEKARDIDLSEVTRLVLVDVRNPERIGPFREIVGKEGVEVHVYDHHPPAPGDITGAVEVTDTVGSTTTVVARIMKERGIAPTPEEATIMMAGIYEDTGSLTYPSTTTKDYEAAAYLLESGADLAAVSDLLRKELSPEEVNLLNEVLSTETTYTIGGMDVVVAEGYLEEAIEDIATLAHKLMDIEGMDCLFMLVDSEDRVHVVARSRMPEAVDVGRVAKALGGGGHPQAASATLKGMTLIQAKEKLLAVLREMIVPVKTAGDIMSYPPITIAPDATLQEAAETMRRYNVNALPVASNGRPEGVVTRQVADKAAYHGLEASPVSYYMTTEFETVDFATPVDRIRELVVGHGQRVLPVTREGRITGVITRTDLLKLLQEELRERPRGRAKKTRNLAGLMRERLPEWALEILRDAGRVAESMDVRAFAVGGFVRDLVMRRKNLDMDIVIEGGDGIEFAREFARMKGLKVRAHKRFKTAVVVFPDGFKLDVATARLEFYEKPGALPTVERSSLKLDLYRRDFIINTLALCLNPERFGELVDFFGGRKDIKEKTIRVLHNLSFVEDPTRVMRAVRFSVKFGFRISTHTLNLIKNAVRMRLLDRVSGARILDELKHILEEEMATKGVRYLNELGVLKLIHPGITWGVGREAFFEKAKETVAWHRLLYTRREVHEWLVLFLALTDPLGQKELGGLAKRLMVEGKGIKAVIGSRHAGQRALRKISSGEAERPSELHELLTDVPLEVILYLMAKAAGDREKKALSLYVTRLMDARTEITGDDLKELGVHEGPLIGEILRQVLKQRLNGELSTRDEEVAFAKSFLKLKKRKKTGG